MCVSIKLHSYYNRYALTHGVYLFFCTFIIIFYYMIATNTVIGNIEYAVLVHKTFVIFPIYDILYV